MREYSVPATTSVAAEENLTDMVFSGAERFPTSVALRRQVDGAWVDVTAREFAAQVAGVAKGLIAAGMSQGDRIGLLSRTSYEWSLIDMAIWAAGGVTVPVYETSAPEQAEWILSDSGSRGVFVESVEHEAMLGDLRDRLPEIRSVWRINANGSAGAITELTAEGASITDEQLNARRQLVRADDLATLIYTSGTTGRPKGCELTHRNLLAEITSARVGFPQVLKPGGSVLMFLPLAHVLARVIYLAALYGRLTLGHTADLRDLVNDLGTFRPTFVLAVPRVFEKVYNGARQKAYAGGKGPIFDAAEAVAVAYSRAVDTGRIPLSLRVKHLVFDRLVYRRLRAALGGRCVAAVSGGAPLGERLAHFFRGVGVTIFEGYGLTETTAAATVNTDRDLKVGTVGRPLAGVRVRIADDGEILIAGDIVFRGYWQDEVATKEAFTDEWFHTGDLGDLDEDGYLRITGRKKEIIVTAGGKNVAPAPLEDALRAHALISQCMVVGDQKPYIAALITIDPDFLEAWKQNRGRPAESTIVELCDDPELVAEIQSAVDEANRSVSKAESIRRFRVLTVDFTEAGGELTPSLKLRRAHIQDTYADDVASLYL